ncbi:MAG: alanine racemase [Saprospiraceae bacterium]|nr:alanine racemase [Saprospiraceae bacterium]
MLHTSYIELSKSALQNNIRYMKDRVGEKTRYSMVVKSNAYGHGLEDLLPMIEDCGVDHFSVFSADEAVRAHRVKRSRCDLMIMGWLDDDHLEWAIENEVSFFVFTMDRLVATIEKSQKCRMTARIHIELETGMHRTGFYEDQVLMVIKVLVNNRSNI